MAQVVAWIAFLLIIATGVLAFDVWVSPYEVIRSWRPTAVFSVAASVLFVVFLFLPWATPHSCMQSSRCSPGLRQLPDA